LINSYELVSKKAHATGLTSRQIMNNSNLTTKAMYLTNVNRNMLTTYIFRM